MNKALSLYMLTVCAFTIHTADINEQSRQITKDIVNQFTDEQKQEALVCMLMNIDTYETAGKAYIEKFNIDQSRLKEVTHPQEDIAQVLRPTLFNTYQIITVNGLEDADRITAYARLHFLMPYYGLETTLRPIIPSKEKLDAIVLPILREMLDAISSEDFNEACKKSIERTKKIYKVYKEHNIPVITEEKFNEIFDKYIQWKSGEYDEMSTNINLLTQALSEQQENGEHENNLLSTYKQAFTEKLEECIKIHSPE